LNLASVVDRDAGFGHLLGGIRVASENGRLGDFLVQCERDVGKRGWDGLRSVWSRSQEAMLVIWCLDGEKDADD
jgi:hypothetical protein